MSKTNQVQLIGNIGQTPKVINTNSTTSIASFSLATNDTYKDSFGNKQQKTEWHNIIAFNKLAELIAEHTKQGTKLMVSGKLQTRQYTNKDGINKYITEIVASDVLFLDNNKENISREEELQKI